MSANTSTRPGGRPSRPGQRPGRRPSGSGSGGGRPPRSGGNRRDEAPTPPTGRRPGSPIWAKLLIAFGALVMVGSGLTVMVPKLVAHWALGDVPQINAIPSSLKGTDINGAINFLLLGTDEGDDPTAPDRSDSMMLVHIPADHSKVYMISFPRDLLVDIVNPQTGKVYATDKLNSAFAYAQLASGGKDTSPEGRGRGAAWDMATISNMVSGGLKYNGWATIDFDGFDKVVQALGSVHMCFDEDAYSVHYWRNGAPADGSLYNHALYTGDYSWGYHYPLNECRDLQPWEALDYSRIRYGLPNGDYDRERHQQQLMRAIVKKMASTDTLTNFNTIKNLKQAVGTLLTLDLGGPSLEDWVFTLQNLRSDDMVMISTNAGKFASETDASGNYIGEKLEPDMVNLLKAVQQDIVFDFLTQHQDWVAKDPTA